MPRSGRIATMMRLPRKIARGTPLRRAVEEGLLDCQRVGQIGLRGAGYAAEEFDWGREQGFRVVQAEECWNRSLEPKMAEVRERVPGGPVYLTFDIEGIDPAYAPGTGTPKIAGSTLPQALEIIRVGADAVEVAPPYDPFGTTATDGESTGIPCQLYEEHGRSYSLAADSVPSPTTPLV